MVDAHGLSHPGPRSSNEDRVLVDPPLGLYAVCDGMGGHHQGGLAAEIALAAIRHFVEVSQDRLEVTWPFGYDFDYSPDANRLRTGMNLANRQIWRRAEQSIECAGMGTTIAAILISGSHAIVGNVGDSRIYRFRAGVLTCLSIDDTMVSSMLRKGLVTDDEARRHPMRNILTHAAGSQEGIQIHISDEKLERGDMYLICSDGLHGTLTDNAIAAVLSNSPSPEKAVSNLITATNDSSASDNVSAIVLAWS